MQHKVAPEHTGEFVVIDIESGDFEPGPDDVADFQRVRRRRSGDRFYIPRVGYRAAHRPGGSEAVS
jgi:hypothetical protein